MYAGEAGCDTESFISNPARCSRGAAPVSWSRLDPPGRALGQHHGGTKYLHALLFDTQLAARVTGVGGKFPCVPTPAAQSYWVREDSGTRHQRPLTDAFSVAALVVMDFLFSTRGDLFCDPDAVYTVLTPAANVQAVPVAAATHNKVQLLLQSCAHARALPTRNRAPLALIY